jgi:tetratricopeptide (TPR) repeat protein
MGWSSIFAGWKSKCRPEARRTEAAGNPEDRVEEAAALHPHMLALETFAILRRCSRAAALLLAVPVIAVYSQSNGPQSLQPSASLQSAEQLLNAGHVEEALAPLRQLAAVQPPVRGAAHDLGLACYRTGKLLEARTAFAQAIREDSTDIESVQMEGLTLYRLGQPAHRFCVEPDHIFPPPSTGVARSHGT